MSVSLSKTPQIGETYTTATNGYVGTVQEVRENKNGSVSLRLDIEGKTHWTTFKG